jgi:hypothetical protein
MYLVFFYSCKGLRRNFSKSPGTLEVTGNKPPGKENRFTSASSALNGWPVRDPLPPGESQVSGMKWISLIKMRG